MVSEGGRDFLESTQVLVPRETVKSNKGNDSVVLKKR